MIRAITRRARGLCWVSRGFVRRTSKKKFPGIVHFMNSEYKSETRRKKVCAYLLASLLYKSPLRKLHVALFHLIQRVPILKFCPKYASELTLMNGIAITRCTTMRLATKSATLGRPRILVIIRRMDGRQNMGPILKVLAIMNQILPFNACYSIKAKVQRTIGSATKISLNKESTEHTIHEN